MTYILVTNVVAYMDELCDVLIDMGQISNHPSFQILNQ